jgi:hypothetical protein
MRAPVQPAVSHSRGTVRGTASQTDRQAGRGEPARPNPVRQLAVTTTPRGRAARASVSPTFSKASAIAKTARMSAPVEAKVPVIAEASDGVEPADAAVSGADTIGSIEPPPLPMAIGGPVGPVGPTGFTGLAGGVVEPPAAAVAPQDAAPPPSTPMPFPHTVTGVVTGASAVPPE